MSTHSKASSYKRSTDNGSHRTGKDAEPKEGKRKRTDNLIEKGDSSMDERSKEYYYGKPKQKRIFALELPNEAPVYPEDPKSSFSRNSFGKRESFDHASRSFFDHLLIYIVMGYLTGIFLVLCLYLLHYRKESSDLNLKWLSIVLLVFLMLIFSYSRRTRCVGLLILPTLAGRKGQWLSIIIAFFIAVAGPLLNIIRNIEIMAHSLSCEQTLLRNALTPMHEIMGEPVYVVEQAVYICLSQVRKLMEHLDNVLQRLEASIVQLHVDYSKCDMWLENQQTFFDNQMGSPYDRCLGAGSVSVQECLAKFPDKPTICQIEHRFEWFCENLKDLPSFFDTHLKEQQELVDRVFKQPLESFAKIRAMFEVSITFDHNAKSGENRDAMNSDLDQHIASELDRQTRYFGLTYVWLYLVLIVVLIFIFLHSLYFHKNYLSSYSYRNVYLTKDFNAYEQTEKANVLPLRSIEKRHYVKLDSLRLLPIEVKNRHRSPGFMLITCLQLFTICYIDYSLFWMLAIMSNQSHKTAELQPPEYTKIIIKNGGMIGDILRGLVQAFEPLSKNLIVDIQRCLPLPRPPKFLRYWEIVMLCILAWFLLFLKEYLLRMRHKLMIVLHPNKAHARVIILHRHILLNREYLIRCARRKARALNHYYFESRITSFLAYYRSALYRLSCGCLGTYKGHYCLICLAQLTNKDYVKCETVNCRGVFCKSCYQESNNQCFLCSVQINHFSYSDISDLEDSSDDPNLVSYHKDELFYPIAKQSHKKN